MNIESLEALVENKLKGKKNIPREVRELVLGCLKLAYQLGQGGSNPIPVPKNISEEELIQAYLAENDVTIIEARETDISQTSHQRLDR